MRASSRKNSGVLLAGSLLFSLSISCTDGAAEPSEDTLGGPELAPLQHPAYRDFDPMSVGPVDRVPRTVDAENRRTLSGYRHPLARPEFEVGAAEPEQAMDKMMLVLRGDDEQESALGNLVLAQNDPSSPLYRKWLSPEEYAQRFGASAGDINRLVAWLQANGMAVDEVAKSNRLILFSGSAAKVENIFRTSMRAYRVDGELHHANATEPSIPSALASVVAGVASLHDFRSRASYAHREFTVAENTTFFGDVQQSSLVPGDLATIYNASPLYAEGIDGTGQTIAVIGRSNIDVANVRTFRSTYGLPANDPVIVLGGNDPGIVCGGDEAEAYLDVEYAGAIAKKATVKFVVAASTQASDGIYLASAYAVNNNVAPIVSLSYGLCERLLGTAGNSFFFNLWQQAAAQGMSVMVASMDSGAAGCDAMESATGKGGAWVNGLGSTPFNTAVGGTQFDDVSTRSQYWASTNDPVTQASALGYIPEIVWNESRGGGLYASGGGTSARYSKPTWQFGLGVLADGKRGVPDVSFAAAIQDPYRMWVDGQPFGGGGTSASTPVFASIMALVLQKTGQTQGLVNPVLYTLAYNQTNRGGAAVFHDITKGNNSVPGVTGFTAGPGYDLATGLGSVDASQLVNHWDEGASLPDLTLVASSPSATLPTEGSVTVSYTVKSNNGITGTVALSVDGLPDGVTAKFTPATIKRSGSSKLLLTAATTAAGGTYSLTVTASNGTVSESVPLELTVTVTPPLSLGISVSYLDIAAGSSKSATITTTRNRSFNASVLLSVTGLPQGVTASLSTTTVKAPGAGTSTLAVKVGASVAGGSYLATVTASGGGITKVAYLTVNILPAPSYSLTLNPTSLTVAQGGTGNVVASTTRTTTFDSAISVKVTGMPSGVTASAGSIPAPGSGLVTLAITVGSSVPPSTYKLTVTTSGGGITKTTPLSLIVSGVTLSASTAALAVPKGGSVTMNLTTASFGGFSAAVSFAVQGLPSGVTATFSPATLAAPGNGTTSVKFTASSSAKAGLSAITFTATAGSTVKSKTAALTVKS
jgi:pseudomonalisin